MITAKHDAILSQSVAYDSTRQCAQRARAIESRIRSCQKYRFCALRSPERIYRSHSHPQSLLDECRMVLPGIQALFGFQLIAVFNSTFSQMLDPFEQKLHLIALSSAAIAIALVMTPAAFHRQTGPTKVTEEFIQLATRLLLWGMGPLLIGLCIDFYLIANLIANGWAASLLTAVLAGIFVSRWFVLPHTKIRRAS